MAKINAINNKSYSLTTDTFITATLGDITATDGDLKTQDLTNTVDGAYVIMNKYRGAGAVHVGDQLGVLTFQGFDSNNLTSGAAIVAEVTAGTIAQDRIPTRLVLSTHPDNNVSPSPTERLNIASTGEVTINAPDSGIGLVIGGGGETITAGDLTLTNGDALVGDTTNTANGPYLQLHKDRTGAVVQVNDQLGVISFTGFDGVGNTIAASITSYATAGTYGATRLPGDIVFATHADAAAPGPVDRMEIQADGSIKINAFTWGAVCANATGVLSSQVPAAAGTVLMSNGPTALPTFQPCPDSSAWIVKHGYQYQFADYESGSFLGILDVVGTVFYFTLPVHSHVGDFIRMAVYNTNLSRLWGPHLSQNANQYVIVPYRVRAWAPPEEKTTTGVGGYIDTVTELQIVCVVEDLVWMLVSCTGTLTAV